jgi:tripartite ATP-independent transporter DctP family solute receptor
MKTSIITIAAAALLGLAAPTDAEAVSFTFATTNGAQDFSTLAIDRWQKAMAEASNGELEMEMIIGGALGGDQELLEQLSNNEIQVHVAGPVVVHRLLPEYQCMEAEFVYDDIDHGYRVWTGDLGKEVSTALEEQYGITIAGVGLRGARELTSNKPVSTPADLEGVKIRVTNPLRSQVFEAFGALPAPLSIAELYGALRQGVFDAQENPVPTIWGNKFYEVQDYVNLTDHVISYYIVSANESFLDSLSEEQRGIFESTLDDAMQWLNDKVRNDTDALLQRMVDEGHVQVIEPDVAAFREIAQPIVAAYAAENCREGLLEDIRAAAQ